MKKKALCLIISLALVCCFALTAAAYEITINIGDAQPTQQGGKIVVQSGQGGAGAGSSYNVSLTLSPELQAKADAVRAAQAQATSSASSSKPQAQSQASSSSSSQSGEASKETAPTSDGNNVSNDDTSTAIDSNSSSQIESVVAKQVGFYTVGYDEEYLAPLVLLSEIDFDLSEVYTQSELAELRKKL